jgi:hypothetical protein
MDLAEKGGAFLMLFGMSRSCRRMFRGGDDRGGRQPGWQAGLLLSEYKRQI